MPNNVIDVCYSESRRSKTRHAFQYDYGQILAFSGFDLPDAFEVHFATDTGSITQIGTGNQVTIPDACFTAAKSVYAWLYLHEGETDGETRYEIEIPVRPRAAITREEPTPAEQSVITQAIAALNNGVERTEAAQEAAETAQESAEAAATRAGNSATDANASRESADQSATNAGISERNARASAQAAAGSASSAAGSATNASGSASAAAGSASTASTKAGEAASSATAAAGSAATAGTKAGEAASSASAAAQKSQEAASSASNASQSATNADTARQAAETAKTGAETAKQEAQTAASNAASSASSASGSATAASQSATAASQSASQAASTVSGAVATINAARDSSVAAVQTKGDEVLESIPADYSELTEDVNSVKSAFNELPTEETGQELLDKETGNAGLTETALAVIGLLFDRMPQNETATDIYYSLLLENERLLAIYEIWEAERSA